jgi:hypothetical protein
MPLSEEGTVAATRLISAMRRSGSKCTPARKRVDLPSEESTVHVTYLRKMLAQQNGWAQQGESENQVHASGS